MRKFIALLSATLVALFIAVIPQSAQATTSWETVNVASAPFIDTLADGTVVTVTFGAPGGYYGASYAPAYYQTNGAGASRASYVKFSFSRPLTSLKTFYSFVGSGDDELFTTDQGPVNLAQTFDNGGNLVTSTGNFQSGQPAGNYSSGGLVSCASGGDCSATLLLQFSTGVNWLEVRGYPPAGSSTAGINLTGLQVAVGSSTVTFDANTGSGSMASQTSPIAANLTSNTLTKNGYTFAGWNTAANGSGTAYANGALYLFNSDTTLFAQWTVAPPAPTPTPTPTPTPSELASTGSNGSTTVAFLAGMFFVFAGASLLFGSKTTKR